MQNAVGNAVIEPNENQGERDNQAALQTDEEQKSRRSVGTIVRASITIICLIIVYRAIDVDKLWLTISKLSISGTLAVALLYIAGQILSAYKWRMFLTSSGVRRSWGDIIRAYFFGMFVNNYFLGTVGGDVARALAIRPGRGERGGAVGSVAADRIHGLGVLTIVGTVAVWIERPAILGPYAPLLGTLASLAFLVGWAVGPRLLCWVLKPTWKHYPSFEAIAKAFPSNLGIFLFACAISAVFHTLQISANIVTAEQCGLDIPWGYMFVVIPIVNIVSTLPISIGGAGVREGLLILLLSPLGVPREGAIAIGAVWLVVVTVVSAIGGFTISRNVEVPSISKRLGRLAKPRQETA